jgi:nitric oxide reductase subunit B
VIETLVWLRVPGDVVFAIGALALGVYAFKLLGARLGKPTLVPGLAAAPR